ncbi:MAG TPA: glycoside hydrolase domain-containing protein [Planctomycetota bacterium]|nr:glycoside hydrolase domain-containing protein [Planctomycetota bacterium]
MREWFARALARVLLAGVWAILAPRGGFAAEAEVVSAQTPWRAFLVTADPIVREKGELSFRSRDRKTAAFDPAQVDPAKYHTSPMPSPDWIKADFDDHCWARYQGDLADFLGGWGIEVPNPDRGPWPARLCVRTCFGIADPAKATDLRLTLVCLGGAVAYVNGQEVGRGCMPPGEIAPLTPADDYPIEAYTTDDGKTPLPVLAASKRGGPPQPDPKWLARYDKRIRTITVEVPSRVLVKGRNVLAIALHRSALAGPLERNGWSHVGFREARLASATGAGVISCAGALTGTHVWSANAVDQVTETPSPNSLIHRSWFWTLYWGRGMPVKGLQQGNPFDPVLPVRMTMPRNGVASGQAILSDPDGLRGVTASMGPLKGPAGAVLPASGVQIRFAVQHPGVHYCDALMAKPPDGATTVPVWLVVQAPKGQAPGWYVSTLSLEANGKKFGVPAQVLVTGLTLPDARDFSSSVGLTHSPETVAKQYNVELWSEAHLKLMDKTLALLGQVGNDVVHVPILVSGVGGTGKSGTRFNWQPIIRWTKTPQGLKPDLTILEKYLDAYARHCAPPRAISLYIWGASSAKEHADAYENRRIPTRENVKYSPPLVVVLDPNTGTASEATVPAIGDEGSEQFWKPLLDGVRALVTRRGWPERVIMLALGGDIRPGQKTAELVKQWAPYARWDFLSHFSGDPAPQDGKMVATGGMEVGMMEWPRGTASLRLPQFEERVAKPYDFLELPTDRWLHQEYSPPLVFRTMTANWGCIGRIGLDFWQARTSREAPRSTSFFSHVESLTVPGPDGPVPTVRFQMLREGVQDAEVKTAIVRAYLKLPEEERKPYQALLDELLVRMGWGSPFYLSQSELGYDWPGYVARLHLAAAELAGGKAQVTSAPAP